MAKLDFPLNPSPGTTYVATNGVTYEWDNSIGIGVWKAVTSIPFAIASAGLISGSPQVGSTLTYTPGSYVGGQTPVAESWTWKKASDGSTLQSNGLTYIIPSTLVGQQVYVEYSVTDGTSTTLTANTNNFPTPPATITTAGFPTTAWNPTPTGAMTAGYPGTSSGTWNGGNGATITATPCVEVSTNGTTYSSSVTVNNGQTLYQRWSSSGPCGGAASGTPISGTVSNGTYTNSYTLTLDRVPSPIADISDSNVPLSSTVTKGTASGISGINATAYVTYVNTSTGTNIQAATAPGGPFTTLATSGTTFPINNGQTLYIRQTVGSTISTGYTAIIRVGDGTNTAGTYDEFTYTANTVTSAGFPSMPSSLQNGPTTSSGTASGVWASGSDTLNATGCLLISTDNVTFNQGPLNILDGQTLYEKWDTSAGCGSAASGTTISGDLNGTVYTQTYSLTLDRTPAAISFTGATNVPLSSVQTSNVVTLSGTNADSYLTYDAASTGDSTTYFAIINGGSPIAIPAAPSTACPVPPGATLAVRQTAGSTASNTRNLVVKLGNSDGTASVSATYAVTTTSNASFPNTTFTPSTGPTASPSTTNLSGPSLFGVASGTWADGIQSIYTTGDLLFRIPPAAFGQTAVTVNPGNTVELAWNNTAALAAASGTGTLTGTLTNGTFINSYTLNVDKASDSYAWTDLTLQPKSTTIQSNTVTITGINCPAELTCTPDLTNPLGTVQASINGGPFTTIPTSGTGLIVNPANSAGTTATTIRLQGDTGTGNGVAYKVVTKLGFGTTIVQDEWSVTTTTATPSVAQPTVINPSGTSVTPSAAGWTSRTGAGTNNPVAITYGNSQYVLVGGNSGYTAGIIYTSPDGVVWTSQTSNASDFLASIAYGISQYVSVGGTGKIVTSPNGTTWTAQTSGTSSQLNGVAYGNSQFAAVGASGTILTSSNGTAWTSQTSGTTNNLNGVTYANSLYVAVGDGGIILTSPNGTTWTPQTSGTTSALYGVTYANSQFLTVGSSGTILTSPNGTTWTSQTSGTSSQLNGVAYGNSLYVTTGSGGTILTSPNGTTWTAQTSGTTNFLFGVAYGNSQFVAVGSSGTILTSTGVGTITLQGDAYVGNDSPGAHTTSDWQLLQMGTTATNPVTAAINTVTQNAVSWTSRTSGTSFKTLSDAVYANSQYVVVGSNGTIITSPNGTTWTSQTSGTTQPLNGVTYGNSLYVTVGAPAAGVIRTSPDGITWTPSANGATNGLNDVIYANSQFVAVGGASASGTVLTSTNGTSWTVRTSSLAETLWEVTFGNSLYVAVGNNGGIFTSPNGITWTAQTSGTTNGLFGVTYGNSQYVAVGASGTILTSSNGTTWTARTSGTTVQLDGVTYGNSQYVAVGQSGTILVSTDGVTWAAQTSGTTNFLNQVIYGNSQFLATGATDTILTSTATSSTTLTLASASGLSSMQVGDTLVEVGGGADATGTITAINTGVPSVTVAPGSTNWTTTATAKDTSRTVSTTDTVLISTNAIGSTSTTAASWTSQTGGGGDTLHDLTFGGGQYVAVGIDSGFTTGVILTSPNGTTWTPQTSGTASVLYSVVYGNSQYVAVGTNGTILTSPNGTTWTPQTSGTANTLNRVTYGNSQYVAVGASGTILTSPNGTTWTPQTSGTASSLSGVTYGNSQYVAVGSSGTILTSPNGTTWTGQTSGTTNGLGSVTYVNSQYVAVGTNGTILTSPNGTTWTSQTSGTTTFLSGVAYGNSQYVAVGASGTILTSPNGTTWTSQTSGVTAFITGVVYGNSLYVAVGFSGTILTSTGATSNLTISGADTDGFAVGNLVSNGLTGASAAFGTITAVNGTTVSVAPSSGGWAATQKLYRGKTIVNAIADTSNLTTYTVPAGDFLSATTYNARVRYNSVNNPPIYTSPWSNWASFGTA